MILYEEIYKKAVVLFDDPKITKAFEENKIAFCKFMYGYFNTASLYRPTVIGRIISDRTEPVGQMEIFKGNGLSNVFKLSITIPENSIIRYTLDGVEVSAKYNKEESSVELGETPYSDEEFAVEYYFPGCINGDFSVIPADDLTLKDIEDKTKNILARLTVISWAEAT